MTRIYANPNTAEVGKYFEAAKARLADGAKSTRDVFDSIDNDHSVKTPTALAGVFEKLNDNFHKDVFDSVLCGMEAGLNLRSSPLMLLSSSFTKVSLCRVVTGSF